MRRSKGGSGSVLQDWPDWPARVAISSEGVYQLHCATKAKYLGSGASTCSEKGNMHHNINPFNS